MMMIELGRSKKRVDANPLNHVRQVFFFFFLRYAISIRFRLLDQEQNLLMSKTNVIS